jgi:hypothetical protein
MFCRASLSLYVEFRSVTKVVLSLTCDPVLDPDFLLSQTWDKKCSDPRDLVYGILTLLSEPDIEGKVRGIVVDYSLPLSKVYADAARYIIESKAALDNMFHGQSILTVAFPSHSGIGRVLDLICTAERHEQGQLRDQRSLPGLPS